MPAHGSYTRYTLIDTQILHSSACLSMPCVRPLYTQYMCTCLFYVHSSYEWITLFVRARVFLCVCVWLCRSLWNDCTVVNKQKQALALMKGCCHLFCRSVTIRAPSGSSDRLFFCITLNKRVQCINLTLLGETKEGPLIQYYNSARMETSGVSSPATHDSAMITAQYREGAVCFSPERPVWHLFLVLVFFLGHKTKEIAYAYTFKQDGVIW